jgi:hypothetical protein
MPLLQPADDEKQFVLPLYFALLNSCAPCTKDNTVVALGARRSETRPMPLHHGGRRTKMGRQSGRRGGSIAGRPRSGMGRPQRAAAVSQGRPRGPVINCGTRVDVADAVRSRSKSVRADSSCRGGGQMLAARKPLGLVTATRSCDD